jgi:formamidopyrimidine-DNA glycosylase
LNGFNIELNEKMPELPEVETFRRFFDSKILGKQIKKVIVTDEKILENLTEKELKTIVEGHKFLKTDRWGKFMFAKLSNEKIIIFHFGMTGDFNFIEEYRGKSDLGPHDRVVFHLKNGDALTYVSQRKFGFVSTTKNIKSYMEDKKFGPDALKITKEEFYERMYKRKRTIKSALLEQSIVSGIGNLYADETLFQMKIHPKARVNSLNESQLKSMLEKVQQILKLAIENEAFYGRFPKKFFINDREKDGACPRCDTTLKSIKIAGRTSYFCPSCQKI